MRGAIEAVPHAREDDLAPVQQRPGGAVVVEPQAAAVEGGPAGAVAADLLAQRGVGTGPAQQRRAALVAQVLLVLNEVAGRGVDRVVRVPRRREVAGRLDGRDLQLRAVQGHAVGLQARGDDRVGHRGDRAAAAGGLEVRRDDVGAGAVLVVGGDVVGEPHQDLAAVQSAPLARLLEGLDQAAQRGRGVADLIGGSPLLRGEAAQVVGQGRGHPGDARPDELLARARGRGVVCLVHLLDGIGLGRVLVAMEQVQEVDFLTQLLQVRAPIAPAPPLPGRIDPLLLQARVLLQVPHAGGHVPQTAGQQIRVVVGRLDVVGPQLRVVPLELGAVPGLAVVAGSHLSLHCGRRRIELGGEVAADAVIPHDIRCRFKVFKARVAHGGSFLRQG